MIMPIVIKEIIVRTTVERAVNAHTATPELLRQVKDMVLKELEHKQQKKEKWVKER